MGGWEEGRGRRAFIALQRTKRRARADQSGFVLHLGTHIVPTGWRGRSGGVAHSALARQTCCASTALGARCCGSRFVTTGVPSQWPTELDRMLRTTYLRACVLCGFLLGAFIFACK